MILENSHEVKRNIYRAHRFFQPVLHSVMLKIDESNEKNDLPNPLDKYRTPVPRLVPRNYY